MSVDEDCFLNGTGKAKSIYQQASTGEKHVLFYPTSSSLPSVNSEGKKLVSDSADVNSKNRTKQGSGNPFKDFVGMKTSEGSSAAPDGGGGGSGEDITNDPRHSFRIGIYGWRKKCLYVLILILLIMVIVNLALTLWVLKVMEFSSEGMGQLKIVSGGLKLEGKTFVLDSLIASSIKSRSYQPILVESTKNLTLRARHKNGVLSSQLVLGNDRLECLTNNFRILDDSKSVLFFVDRNEVIIGSESLKVTGEGGTSFKGSIQTTLVRAEAGHDLRLESPTRSLSLKSTKSIHLESRGGQISTLSLSDLTLRSEVGAIKLETGSVVMPRLPTAKVGPRMTPTTGGNVYQLCVCESGKLFLASPHLVCAAESDDRVCR